MPPTLNLPEPVSDLTAVRTGNEVLLTWKMPKKTTDKLLLKGAVPVRVCRKEGSGACVAVPGNLAFPPEAAGSFKETLPQALAVGEPRALSYFVELTQPQWPFRWTFECGGGAGRARRHRRWLIYPQR
jgi:hypothetical protein